jgi:hypothetical protein
METAASRSTKVGRGTPKKKTSRSRSKTVSLVSNIISNPTGGGDITNLEFNVRGEVWA